MRMQKRPAQQHRPKNTSWSPVAAWYDEHLENNDDTYQKQVILPNLLRVLHPQRTDRILDIACGQGYFSREIAKTGAKVTASDISSELIKKAREHSDTSIAYHVAPADAQSFAKDHSYDAAIIILAIQNIENIQAAFTEMHRVLAPNGRGIIVMNHPTFRIPRHSDWSWDEKTRTQFRKTDRYLSAERIDIVAHPGDPRSETTPSFHRSLQDIFKPIAKAGFAVTKLEEWVSHKQSETGPRAKAEDAARREIPLFLMLEIQPV